MATGQTAKTKTLISIDPALKEKAAATYAAKGLTFSQGVTSMLESSFKKEAVSLDKSTLDAAKPVLEDMGLDASTACNVFLRELARCGGMPFAVRSSSSNYGYSLVELAGFDITPSDAPAKIQGNR